MLVLGEADVVEDEELRLGPEVGGVGEPRGLHVRLGLLGHVPRVTAVGLEGERVVHEAVQVQRLVLAERVHDGGRRVREKNHVRFVDLLEAADGRAVEAESLAEAVLGQSVSGDREVLHEAGQVAEPEVDDLDPLVLHETDDLRRTALLHDDSLSCVLLERTRCARSQRIKTATYYHSPRFGRDFYGGFSCSVHNGAHGGVTGHGLAVEGAPAKPQVEAALGKAKTGRVRRS